MKTRRTLILCLVLAATLCVGVGYAAFSSRMAINGEAVLPGVQVSEVVFTDAVKDGGNDNITVTASGQDTSALTVIVSGFQFEEEYAIVKATIENPHPFAVTLSTPAVKFVEEAGTQVDASEYFDVVIEGTAPTSIDAAEDAETPATAEISFRVTARKITPTAKTQNFVVSFLASAA